MNLFDLVRRRAMDIVLLDRQVQVDIVEIPNIDGHPARRRIIWKEGIWSASVLEVLTPDGWKSGEFAAFVSQENECFAFPLDGEAR
jgi:hypothetical protein